MEPSKKDFSPEQLKDLLWEIERAPHPNKPERAKETSAELAHSLGEELEEVPVFGSDHAESGEVEENEGLPEQLSQTKAVPEPIFTSESIQPSEPIEAKPEPLIQPKAPKAKPAKELPMENWLREMADHKIDAILQKQNLEDNINQILREVLPTLSERIITQEIEKIKEQIKDL